MDACHEVVAYIRTNTFLSSYLNLKMVRLITHNLLACHAKGCTTNNFPLLLQDVQIELHEQEFNPGFIKNILPRLEWRALVEAATLASTHGTSSHGHILKWAWQVGDASLPLEQPEMTDDEFWQKLHHVLLEVHHPLSLLIRAVIAHND